MTSLMTSTTGMVDVDKFVEHQSFLLGLEREAELQQSEATLTNLSAKGVSDRGLGINNLVIRGQRVGLFGKTLVDLVARVKDKEFPSHSLGSGDIVGLLQASSQIASGVVTALTASSIEVSFDESQQEAINAVDDGEVLRIIKLANDVTYKRLKRALEDLSETSEATRLKNCLFGLSTFSPPSELLPPKICDHEGKVILSNRNLDASQREAVRFALLQKELAIIHGPPGTGKTTTVTEVIMQAVKCGNKVLCCAPSNVAVDNLLEKLAGNNLRLIRLGHPARVHQRLQNYSLDARISSSEQTKIVRDVRQDIITTVGKLKKARSKSDRGGLNQDIRELRKELREREKKALKELLASADVILSTLTSAAPDGPLKHLPSGHFDITVIDECSQALELACWIVLPLAKKAILAGDHHQLPPTIISEEAARKGLSLTLMERVIKSFKNQDVVRMLQIQYRMHEKIMLWSSESFYDDKLKAHESVVSHLLKDLPSVKPDDNTEIPLLFIDTSGCELFESDSSDEISKANEGEVVLVCVHVEKLIVNGVDPSDIAIITPYNLQVELLRTQLKEKYPTLEIRSVDGFQGREKEAVVMSLVRSNPKGDVGFLAEIRRLNVAVTRGRRHVAVIGDSHTVQRDSQLKTFIDFLHSHGEVRSAMEYQNDLDTRQVVRPSGVVLTLNDEESFAKKKGSIKSKSKQPNGTKPQKPPGKRGANAVKPTVNPTTDTTRSNQGTKDNG